LPSHSLREACGVCGEQNGTGAGFLRAVRINFLVNKKLNPLWITLLFLRLFYDSSSTVEVMSDM
jgi:hypothetical protein